MEDNLLMDFDYLWYPPNYEQKKQAVLCFVRLINISPMLEA